VLDQRTKHKVFSEAWWLSSSHLGRLIEGSKDLNLRAITVIKRFVRELIKLVLINDHYMFPWGFFIDCHTLQRFSALSVLRYRESEGISVSIMMINSFWSGRQWSLFLFKFIEVSCSYCANFILNFVEQIGLHQVDLRCKILVTVNFSTFHCKVIRIIILVIA
jgi:hypothetical protein